MEPANSLQYKSVLPPCCFCVIIVFILQTMYICLAFLMHLATSLIIFHRYEHYIIL
jgi:hypothetical protein